MSLLDALMEEFANENTRFRHSAMRGHMRSMNTMMNSVFGDAFGDMLGRGFPGQEMVPFMGVPRDMRGREVARFDDFGMGFPMMGMGFPHMRSIFQDMSSNPNCHSFSSSTIMTMTAGPDGRPQVYQASQSVKQGPGGVRETKKTVADSRTGVKKMAIGHHIQDRAHIIEREQNVYSGEQEERQDFINLDEEEVEEFNKEWQAKTRHNPHNNMMRNMAIDYGHHSRRRPSREPQLALPSSQPQPQRSREEGWRSELFPLKKRKHQQESEVVIEEVDSSDDNDQDAPQAKQMKIESKPIVSSPTPSSASSDDEDTPDQNDIQNVDDKNDEEKNNDDN